MIDGTDLADGLMYSVLPTCTLHDRSFRFGCECHFRKDVHKHVYF